MSAANNNRPPVKLRWMQPCGRNSGPPNCRTSTRQAGFQSCCTSRGAARSWLLHQADDEATTTANSGDGGSTTRNTNSIPHQQGPRDGRDFSSSRIDARPSSCQEGSILQAGPLVKRSSMVQQCTMPQPSASKNGVDSSHASIGGEPRQSGCHRKKGSLEGPPKGSSLRVGSGGSTSLWTAGHRAWNSDGRDLRASDKSEEGSGPHSSDETGGDGGGLGVMA